MTLYVYDTVPLLHHSRTTAKLLYRIYLIIFIRFKYKKNSEDNIEVELHKRKNLAKLYSAYANRLLSKLRVFLNTFFLYQQKGEHCNKFQASLLLILPYTWLLSEAL